MDLNRRTLVTGSAGAGLLAMGGLVASPAAASPGRPSKAGNALPKPPKGSPEHVAGQERFWASVARHYDMTDDVINFENGYFGANPKNVRRAFTQATEKIQHENSWYMRREYGSEVEQVRVRIAQEVGASVEEIAITRGATEALQALIAGYNRLGPGDAVAYADLDYDSMQYAMEWLRDRRGVEVIKTNLPEPATRQAVLDHYERLLTTNPKIKLLLLTHVSHRTGLVPPIAAITEMAAARGVDTVVDAAHSWGQLDFSVKDLGSPFVGFNLHKWIGAPLGCGFMYIQEDRLPAIDRHFGDQDYGPEDVRSRIHTGTANSANYLAVPAALDFHAAVGAPYKQARLRLLRDRWVHQVLEVPNVEILTPEDPLTYGAITAFRITGNTTSAQTTAIANYMTDEWGVFTVRRGGVAAGEVLRVSPALYNDVKDADRAAEAIRAAARRFRVAD
ncbi:aminotransferase class V-fold PLP-dependent enzyme [Citricoccus nitrophenolicus]|uniref:aminotransferase class V-fold PLP-dependent enzyme n=1 Tax=Citricoccus nitrophenolicus TaxID=863575 RepID=UPI0039B42989